jgi:hypothetical protein
VGSKLLNFIHGHSIRGSCSFLERGTIQLLLAPFLCL